MARQEARKSRLALSCSLLAVVALLAACIPKRSERPQPPVDRKRKLAEYWSPVIYQSTDAECFKCDYITKFNFDGDYNGSNNWNNLGDVDTVPAYVYYALSETTTHLFIGYYFFHPRDWGLEYGPLDVRVPGTHHENDLEGILVVVEKTGGADLGGELVGVETLAHRDLYQFAYCPDRDKDGTWEPTIQTDGRGETVDGCISVYTSAKGVICNGEEGQGCDPGWRRVDRLDDGGVGVHPRIAIESGGHGVGACCAGACSNPMGDGIQCDPQAPGGDGIVYYYGDRADSPDGGSGNYARRFSYQLIAMDAGTGTPGEDGAEDQGFWYLREHIGPDKTFHAWGIVRGDDDDGPDMDYGAGLPICQQNAAKAPWAWDDGDDGQVFVGGFFCDPAFAFDSHVNGATDANYSLAYTDHAYYTHRFGIQQVHLSSQEGCGEGDDCDVYLNAYAGGSPGAEQFISELNWKVDDMRAGDLEKGSGWIDWWHGGYDATGTRQYGEKSFERYICRAGGPSTVFTIEAWDADDGGDNQDDPIDPPYRFSPPADSLDDPQGTNLGHISIKLIVETK